VAAIPVSAEDAGLRGLIEGERRVEGPRTPMRIEVVEPEVLWDARADGFQAGLRGPMEAAARAGAEAAVQATVERVSAAIERPQPAARPSGVTVQLGAFSSREAAQAAWARLSGQAALAELSPQLEPVEREGRTLYRLRAGPVAAEAVTDVCRAANAGDWCASTARS